MGSKVLTRSKGAVHQRGTLAQPSSAPGCISARGLTPTWQGLIGLLTLNQRAVQLIAGISSPA